MTTADLRVLVDRLASLEMRVPAAEQVEQLGLLEQVKNAASAVQARLAVAFDASQREEQAQAGVPASRQGRGVAEQVALARRESPSKGSRLLGLANLLAADLPRTLDAMTAGLVSEWRATLVAQAAVVLEPADRRQLDAALAPRLPRLSDRQVYAEARAAAYRADPQAAVNRGRRAAADRRVTVRPAPDVMAFVSGYVPAAQGVAVFKALDVAARTARSEGDSRSLDQIKADTFVQRLTGQASAEAVPFEVGLVMTDTTLLEGDQTPARLEHHGPIPAGLARELLSRAETAGTRGWLRRLFTDPVDGTVATIDTRRRRFDGPLRRLVVHRDQHCRTPWCGAPIRDADHVVAHSLGGPTTADNGQGLCQACNLARAAPGWTARRGTEDGRPTRQPVVITTTPTGATHPSAPPPVLPGWPPGLHDPPGERDGYDQEPEPWLAEDVITDELGLHEPDEPGPDELGLDEPGLDELGVDLDTWTEAIMLTQEQAA
jgi:hypothetical protein